VLTMGRVGVDLYPEQAGVPLAAVRTFAKSLGGTATNVAVAASRLGRRAALITKVGDDGFGAYVRAALAGFGVDTRYVGTDERLRTPVVFCELNPPEDPPLLFYREPSAPDIQLRLGELDLDTIAAVSLFWVTGTGLSAEPSRAATLGALHARRRAAGRAVPPAAGRVTVLDLDWRPMFWSDAADATRVYREALGMVTAAVGNRAEAAVAVGTDEPVEAARRLLDLGVELAVVKLGGDGALVATRTGMVEVAPVPVRVVCALGAGDAFGGALCHGLLAGMPADQAVRLANAAGALVASRLACADAMPTLAEIQALLDARPGHLEGHTDDEIDGGAHADHR
jgi:5-dehydro-2-deoxygluconokinase